MDLGEPASEPDAEGGAEAGEESTEFEQPAANDAQQAEGDAQPAAAKAKPAAKRGLLVSVPCLQGKRMPVDDAMQGATHAPRCGLLLGSLCLPAAFTQRS